MLLELNALHIQSLPIPDTECQLLEQNAYTHLHRPCHTNRSLHHFVATEVCSQQELSLQETCCEEETPCCNRLAFAYFNLLIADSECLGSLMCFIYSGFKGLLYKIVHDCTNSQHGILTISGSDPTLASAYFILIDLYKAFCRNHSHGSITPTEPCTN